MNKKNYTITLFFCFIACSNIYSQVQQPVRPFEKIKFDGLNPIWHHTFFDTTYSKGYGDGYNRLALVSTEIKPIVVGNYLYIALHHLASEEVIGTYIKKIDLSSGKEIWSDYFGLPKDTNQEIARLMYINNNGNLELISQLKTDPYGFDKTLLYNKDMLFTKRIYNQENGSLIEWYRPDNNDTLHLRSIYTMFQYSGELLKKDDELVYIQRVLNGNPNPDYSITKSKNNIFTKDLNRSYLKSEDAMFISRIIPHGNDGYIIPEMNRARNKLTLRFVDDQFKEMDVKSVDDSSLNFLQLISTKPDEEKLLFFHFLKDDNPTDYFEPCEIRLYDYNANLLKRFAVPIKYSASFCVLDWDTNDNIIIAASNLYSNGSAIERNDFHILKLTGTESTLIKSFASIDSLRYLNLNNALNTFVTKIDDTKILMSAVERSLFTTEFGISNDASAIAQSLFLLDVSNLGIVSTKDENKEEPFMSIGPNPVTEIIKIRINSSNFKGSISILDNMGRAVKNIKMDHEKTISIPVDDLPTGIYYVKALASGAQYIPVQKFIKI